MKINYKYTTIILSVLVITLTSVVAVLAGNTDSPSGPTEAGSQMYTLEQIYERLDVGTAGTKMTTFTEPSSGPGSTMHTLDEIMAAAPALDNTNGATTTNVLAGQTFWGLTASQWATRTGTMPNNGAGSTIVPTTTNQSVAAGYWSSINTVLGDTDLISVNIKSEIDLFGVSGSLHGGCHCANGTLNGTRWCDNGDGTVTDLLGDSTNNNVGQCLVWLKNANCSADLVGINKTSTLNWDDAMVWSSVVSSGNCGLSDGSTGYEWRLPTIAELDGITNGTDYVRSSSMQAFTGVQPSYYWSSTSNAHIQGYAWSVSLSSGVMFTGSKTYGFYAWPVRGGQ